MRNHTVYLRNLAKQIAALNELTESLRPRRRGRVHQIKLPNKLSRTVWSALDLFLMFQIRETLGRQTDRLKTSLHIYQGSYKWLINQITWTQRVSHTFVKFGSAAQIVLHKVGKRKADKRWVKGNRFLNNRALG